MVTIAKELSVCVGEDQVVTSVDPADEFEVMVINRQTGRIVSVFGDEVVTVGDACRRIAVHRDLVRDLDTLVGELSTALIKANSPIARTVYAPILDRARKTLAAAREGALLVAA